MNRYEHNRQRLMEKVPGSLVLLPAFKRMQQTNDAAAPFIQEANFFYLTGITEPGWLLVLNTASGDASLIAPDANEYVSIFHGDVAPEKLAKQAGTGLISKKQLLAQLKNHTGEIYTPLPESSDYFIPNPVYAEVRELIESSGHQPKDCRLALAGLRAIKQDYELVAIRDAIKLTIDAFASIKPTIQTASTEADIEAAFTMAIRSQLARHAYDPIVASGPHACVLHYDTNNAPVKQNSFLLIDIGARIDGYAADITRTYAVGKLTDRQKAVHRAVQEAESQIIGLLKPGLKIAEYLDQADTIMKQKLVSLQLIKNDTDNEGYRKYMPHSVSHGLGIDVHDSLGRPKVFESGMVLTVEPGIYIPEEGIGVRIEDDILITESGHENLSEALSTDW